MSWSKMNINKLLCENSAIFGLFLDCTFIWALNLSSQFLMAHILGQPQAEKDLYPKLSLPRVILQPSRYYIKHGLWYQMASKRVISVWVFEKQGFVFLWRGIPGCLSQIGKDNLPVVRIKRQKAWEGQISRRMPCIQHFFLGWFQVAVRWTHLCWLCLLVQRLL